MTHRPLRLSAAAVLLPLALTLTACGGDDEAASDAATPTSSTSTAATPDDSASASDAADTGEAGEESGSPITADDVIALYSKAFEGATSAKLSMTGGISGQTFTATGAGDYAAGDPQLALSMDMGAAGLGSVDMRLVGKNIYMKFQGTNGKWVVFPLDDPTGPLASLGNVMEQFDPRSGLTSLKKAFIKGSYLGEDDVEGRSTKKYTFTVDTLKSIGDLPGMTPQVIKQLPTTTSQTVWIDDDGRLAKVVSGFEGQQVTVVYSDWGSKVDISAPPKSQITDVSSFAG